MGYDLMKFINVSIIKGESVFFFFVFYFSLINYLIKRSSKEKDYEREDEGWLKKKCGDENLIKR